MMRSGSSVSCWNTCWRPAAPRLLEAKGDGGPIRVWSAGCATGEEAYSAMLPALSFPFDPLSLFSNGATM